ncbi:sigma-70 family RNA polymerase sigma factor [uncultured Sanguibacteroides sp.]|uniref:RNA polymerase sigma factor n=1 Tax=uncultured Sanguibacteroides sp. TaxID=1635151 RepID=UPI0025F073B3|nr:sigma-70 family RNA polymerase sigma factor [uncultured Sanguibacteroides sp.]
MDQEIEKEFIGFIQDHQRIIYKVCYMYSRDAEHLNDLYQETVINLWQGFPEFRKEAKPSTWVYRIALNTSISYFRRFLKKSKTVPIMTVSDLPVDERNIGKEIEELHVLINRLGQLEKALILLYLEEKPYQEIAVITGLSVSNVATKLSRIKEKLKKMSND